MGSVKAGVLRHKEEAAVVALAMLVIVSTVALLGASRANAAWTRYPNLAKTLKPSSVSIPRVALAPDGSAVFIWTRDGGLRTRVAAPNGMLGPVQPITATNTVGAGPFEFSPGLADLAVDPDGTAIYAWRNGRYFGRSVQTRVRHADGTLSPVRTLATAQGTSPSYLDRVHVGVDGTGRAVFSWIRYRPDPPALLQARSRSATGELGPVVNIGAGGLNLSQMTVTPQGRALFAWESHGRILGRAMTAGGDLGPLLELSASGEAPHVVAAGDIALFSWLQRTADGAQIMARELSPGGSLGSPQVIASGDLSSSSVDRTAAMAPDGTAALCWSRATQFECRTRSPSGFLGPIENVSGLKPGRGEVGIDSGGALVFAWNAYDGDRIRVYARTQPVDGSLGPIRALSPVSDNFNAYFGNLAVNPAGDAAVVWQLGKRGFAVQGATGP